MIQNDNDIARAIEFNKIYVPELYNKNTYYYYFSGDNIQIITNNNCYTQYSTIYCDCYMYNLDYNTISNSVSCSRSSSGYQINYNYITSDINFSNRATTQFFYSKGILLLIVILAILFATMLLKGKGGYSVY